MKADDSVSGVPRKRLCNTFSSFDVSKKPWMQRAYSQAVAVSSGKAWCAFLVGDPDCGKTHLAIAAMNAYHRDGLLRSRFWTVPDFLEWLRVSRYGDDRRERSIMEIAGAYLEQDILLVLDDLGVENQTDWAYEQLYRVINARRDNELPTIVTSNLSEKNGLDQRFVSRLKSGLVVCRKSESGGMR